MCRETKLNRGSGSIACNSLHKSQLVFDRSDIDHRVFLSSHKMWQICAPQILSVNYCVLLYVPMRRSRIPCQSALS